MNLPKVKFDQIPPSLEIDLLHGFLFNNKWGWGKYIIKKHKSINKIYQLKDGREQVSFLKKFTINSREENKNLIKTNKAKYKKSWNKIQNQYFKNLSQIIEVNWPKQRKFIKAMISLNPICPRFLNNWSFSIFYNYKKISRSMEVIMHECCHFLYFEKWKKLYPKMNSKKFESPYIEWHLSEIIAPIILNDKRIQKILKQKAVFYLEHSKIKIDKKTVPKYFTDLYNKNINKENGFEVFLKEAYKIMKKNKNLFKF